MIFLLNTKKNNHNENIFTQSKRAIKSIILDLRGNPGGLLDQAIDISEKFLDKGDLVVSVIGRDTTKISKYLSEETPLASNNKLVVLIDGGSASASEIVAGAIKDHDRGVIIGETSFGKGLVQNVLPLPYNSKIKITIAKYYIPSGRCIQAIDYFDDKDNIDQKIPDSLLTAYKTEGGRKVFDGAGIFPDIDVKPESYSQISADLYAGNYIFNYVNTFVKNHSEIAEPQNFYVSDETYNEFKDFVAEEDFEYLTETEMLIERLSKSAERESYLDAIKNQLDELEASIREEKKADIDKFKSEIEEMLRIEIVSRYYYQKGKLRASLQTDKEVKRAIELLGDQATYESILEGTYPPDEQK